MEGAHRDCCRHGSSMAAVFGNLLHGCSVAVTASQDSILCFILMLLRVVACGDGCKRCMLFSGHAALCCLLSACQQS